jgi:hypothetical protein
MGLLAFIKYCLISFFNLIYRENLCFFEDWYFSSNFVDLLNNLELRLDCLNAHESGFL